MYNCFSCFHVEMATRTSAIYHCPHSPTTATDKKRWNHVLFCAINISYGMKHWRYMSIGEIRTGKYAAEHYPAENSSNHRTGAGVCVRHGGCWHRSKTNYLPTASTKWYTTCLIAQSCLTLRPHGLYPARDSPGKNSRVGCHFLLQWIFTTQGSNPGIPHCRWTLCYLSHQGTPKWSNIYN